MENGTKKVTEDNIHPARQEYIPGSARCKSPPQAAPSVKGLTSVSPGDFGRTRRRGYVFLRLCPAWFPPVRLVCPSRPVGPIPGPGRVRLRRSVSRLASSGSGGSARPAPWAQSPGRVGRGSVGVRPGGADRSRSGCLSGLGAAAGPAGGKESGGGCSSAVRLSCLISV